MKTSLSIFLLLLITIPLAMSSSSAKQENRQTQCRSGEFRPLNACYAQYCQKCVDQTGKEFERCIEVLRPRTPCIVSNKVVEDR